MINNPDYKVIFPPIFKIRPTFQGKWKPKMMANPDYKGKWAPRNIPNPDYFEDLTPFKSLAAFDKIGFELWTLSSDIYFDNIIITSDEAQASDLYHKVAFVACFSNNKVFRQLYHARKPPQACSTVWSKQQKVTPGSGPSTS